MSCTKPMDGYRASGGTVIIVARGDRPPREATSRVPMAIPCGKCPGCRLEYARQWGVRCLHEKKMWPHSKFVTLTYKNEMLPEHGCLVQRDVQLFMKRLRIHKERVYKGLSEEERKVHFPLGPRVRHVICGEYGEENGRPHYHALLFNCDFGDMVFFGRNKRGEALYTSVELSRLWSVDGQEIGHCTVGEVTFDSAVYCAKYSLKKVNGNDADIHYEVVSDGGEVVRRPSEFAIRSTRPGIGGTFFDKYGPEIVANDSVIVNGREVRPPRYYDLRAKKSGLVSHEGNSVLCKCSVCANKRKRKRLAVLNRHDNTPARLRVKERLMVIAAEKKERNL